MTTSPHSPQILTYEGITSLTDWYAGGESRWCRVIPAITQEGRPFIWDMEDWGRLHANGVVADRQGCCFLIPLNVVAMTVDGAISVLYAAPLKSPPHIKQEPYNYSSVANMENDIIARVAAWVLGNNKLLRMGRRRSDVATICYWNDRMADFAEVVAMCKELGI